MLGEKKIKCSICDTEHDSLQQVLECEKRGYRNPKGLTIGAKIVISGGDGHKEMTITGFETHPHSHDVCMVICGESRFNIRIVELA